MYKLVIKDDESNKTVIAFYRQEITIGREEGNTIRLTEQNVSRKHAILTKSNNLIFLEDNKSYVGTFLNKEPIQERVQLNNGDEIKIGDYLITIINENEDNEETVLVNDSSDNNQNDKKIKPVPISEITGKKADESKMDREPEVSYPLKPPYNKIIFQDTNLAGTSFDILKSIMTIGKSPDCDIIISNKSFSDIEAKIICNENSVKIKEISGGNKLKVNGDPYSILELREGDIISISSVSFRYCDKRSSYVYKKGASSSNNTKLFIIIGIVILIVIAAVLGTMDFGKSKKDKKNNKNNKKDITINKENNKKAENIDKNKVVDKKENNDNKIDDSNNVSPELLNLLASGKQLVKDKNWERASEVYNKILKKNPNNKDAQKNMDLVKAELKNKKTYLDAIKLFSKKQYKKSIDMFDTIPKGTYYYNTYTNKRKASYFEKIIYLTDEEMKKKNYKKAREYLSIANQIFEDRKEVIDRVQWIDKKTNTKKKVIKNKSKVKRTKNTNLARSLNLEAQSLVTTNKFAAAVKKIKAAIKADPSYSKQYMTAGIIYKKMGRNKQAIKYLKIYLKLEPKAGNANAVRKLITSLQ